MKQGDAKLPGKTVGWGNQEPPLFMGVESVTETTRSCLSLGAGTELTGAEVSAPMPYFAAGEWEKGRTKPLAASSRLEQCPRPLVSVGASIIFGGSGAGPHSSLWAEE